MKRSCLIVAGEKSGEEHSMSFLPQLMNLLPDVEFFGVGGEAFLQQQNKVQLLYHLKEFSSWGAAEVLHKIPFYYKAMKTLLREVEARNCRVAILVDFQTFNLTLAQKLKKKGVQVLYFVAPQAWAWKAWRGKVLARTVHTLFTIIPFEKKWFEERGVQSVKGVVHPVLFHYQNSLSGLTRQPQLPKNRPIRILLLPGSREFEVSHLLPIFLEAIEQLKKQFSIETMVVKSSTIAEKLFNSCQNTSGRKIDHSLPDTELTSALQWADLCLACSGTVTLTTGLFAVPTIVCYKASLFTAFIYDNFISYRGSISLTNIVHEERVFPELIQDQVSIYNLEKIVRELLTDPTRYARMVMTLQQTEKRLLGDDFSVPHYMASVIDKSYDNSQ